MQLFFSTACLSIDYTVLVAAIRKKDHLLLCRSPVGWGSTYCFTAVGVGVGVTAITKAPPAQIFFWVACFFFPRSLAFDFCCDLDIWGQGQASVADQLHISY